MNIDILEQGRRRAEQYNSEGGSGFHNAGRINAYECRGCGSYIVTVDRDPGVTPFGIKCGHCGGLQAYSKLYKVAPSLEPTHEWYRPESLDGIDARYHEHLSNGGLILRSINGDGWSDPFMKERPKTGIEEMAAMRRAFEDAKRNFATMSLDLDLTRQQRRYAKRKAYDPPEEIQMYGRTYRRID